jgi:peptidoglycan/xylan/chitin deacetylase (PgdA/CDA1 family)
MYLILIIVIVLCIIAFLTWASADIRSGVYLSTLCQARTTGRSAISLTFDDGPDPHMTPRILEILERHNIKAVFFLIGRKAEEFPDIVRQIQSKGHTIGNHTYSHSIKFTIGKQGYVRHEISMCQDIIGSITGKRPLLFRPPFGVTNPIISKAVSEKNLLTIGWSIRSLDTISNKSTDAVYRRISRKLHNGAVVLLHDRLENADILLNMILEETEHRKIKAVSIEELLDIRTYDD